MKEVEYLGHIVSHEGVKVEPNKIKAMMDCDAGASQASQRGDNGQLEKRPAKILKLP